MLLLGAYLLLFLLPDFWRSLDGPEWMTLAAAEQTASDERLYVAIMDGKWQCDTIRYIVDAGGSRSTGRTTRVTKVSLTNQTGEVTALAAMSGKWNCAELQATQPIGYLSRADAGLTLCGYCGQSNSLIGLEFAFDLTAAGLGLLIFGGFKWRNERR